MKRSTARFFTATAIAGVGLVGLAAVGLADDGHRRWGGMHGGGHYGMGMGMGGPGAMHEMFLGFDANEDGKLTQEEIDQGRADQLRKFDKDGDGALSLTEYEALWLDVMRESMVDRFQEHDADGDGKVTTQEFGKRFANMVKFMDANGDGVLDETDMMRRHGEGERGRMHEDDD